MLREHSPINPMKFVRRKGAALLLTAVIAASSCKGGAPTPSLATPDNSLKPIPTDTAMPITTPGPTLEITPAPELTPANTPPPSNTTTENKTPYSGIFVRRGDQNQKIIYITIDDLWYPQYVQQAVDTANKYHAGITLFPIGHSIDTSNYPSQPDRNKLTMEVYNEAIADGDGIGDHTYDHVNIDSAAPVPTIKNNLEAQLTVLQFDTGLPSLTEDWLRTPGGECGSPASPCKNVGEAAEEEGMGILYWTYSAGGDSGLTSDQVFANVKYAMDKGANGFIILMHGYPNDVDALDEIFSYGIANGYTFANANHIVPDPASSCTFDTAKNPDVLPCSSSAFKQNSNGRIAIVVRKQNQENYDSYSPAVLALDARRKPIENYGRKLPKAA